MQSYNDDTVRIIGIGDKRIAKTLFPLFARWVALRSHKRMLKAHMVFVPGDETEGFHDVLITDIGGDSPHHVLVQSARAWWDGAMSAFSVKTPIVENR